MLTVHEVSAMTGVSVRALHHYDAIGLLKPDRVTEAGYRLYGGAALERLQHILLFRELQFPLKDIRAILDSPGFERGRALAQQIRLLELKKARLENLIDLAKGLKATEVGKLDFSAFDTKKIDEYARQAKASWGQTAQWREYEAKSKGRTREEARDLSAELMGILAAFGGMRDRDPADAAVQAQVKKLQDYITAHYYACSDQVLAALGGMYAAGGDMTENIDAAGGAGTAACAARAIEVYCEKRSEAPD